MGNNMNSKSSVFFSPPVLAALLALAACSMSASSALAQQVFRIVGADGRVTFSDKPPAQSAAPVTTGNATASGAAGATALPFELRQIAAKYPVTLYTGADCGPCGTARTMLTARGVPFTEKTVASNEDIAALQRLSGDNSLPFATVGGQQLKGYADVEWTQFLDAAGYPKRSVLPTSYRLPAATPLVAAAQAPSGAAQGDNRAVARPAPATSAPPAAPASGPTPSNPAGIKF